MKKKQVSLSDEQEPNILVQTTSRNHTWVQATKQYTINDIKDMDTLRRTSDRSEDKPFEKKFKDFLELSTDKRPDNDSSGKNPETPEG